MTSGVSSRSWTPCNNGGKWFCNQGPADCRDALDYTLCASIANAVQCPALNTIDQVLGVLSLSFFRPCPATCGTCEYNLFTFFSSHTSFIFSIILSGTMTGVLVGILTTLLPPGCGDSNYPLCWLVQITMLPSCLIWGNQCRYSCFTCGFPIVIGR